MLPPSKFGYYWVKNNAFGDGEWLIVKLDEYGAWVFCSDEPYRNEGQLASFVWGEEIIPPAELQKPEGESMTTNATGGNYPDASNLPRCADCHQITTTVYGCACCGYWVCAEHYDFVQNRCLKCRADGCKHRTKGE